MRVAAGGAPPHCWGGTLCPRPTVQLLLPQICTGELTVTDRVDGSIIADCVSWDTRLFFFFSRLCCWFHVFFSFWKIITRLLEKKNTALSYIILWGCSSTREDSKHSEDPQAGLNRVRRDDGTSLQDFACFLKAKIGKSTQVGSSKTQILWL